jgi:hypothetical protein
LIFGKARATRLLMRAMKPQRDKTMHKIAKIVGAAALTAVTGSIAPAWAGPLPVTSPSVSTATASTDSGLIKARWVGRGWGWGPGAVVGGIAAGVIGGAIAADEWGYGPYPYGYGYAPAYYGGPYYYGGWGGPYWHYRHWHRW